MKKEIIPNVLYETAYAEYGSALEMFAACKKSSNKNEVFGFFEHAKDEYIHTKKFLEILKKFSIYLNDEKSRNYRFLQLGALKKGYISNDGFLVERLNKKDFVAYVYANELLAKNEFSKILKLINKDKNSIETIISIMNDELRHHEMAKKYFLKYFPLLQPYQLEIYKYREFFKNRIRKFHFKNSLFLGKLFTPIFFLLSILITIPFKLLDLCEFDRKNKNLMQIDSKSVL